MTPLLMLVVVLLLSYILAELGKSLGVPRVVGQITAGLILSQDPMRSLIFSSENMVVLGFLANLGVLLLFYYVGLEASPALFRKHIERGIAVSVLKAVTPFVLGFSVLKALGYDTVTSSILGVALSLSSQAASVDLLDELKMLKSKVGATIVSAGAISDMLELLAVSILLSSLHIGFGADVLQLLGSIVLFVFILASASLFLLPALLRFFDLEHSSTARFTGALVTVLLIASLAEYLRVGALIGAMLAGVMVRRTIYKDVTLPDWEEHDIARSTHIIAFGFLIPVFFVWVGLQTDITAAAQMSWFIVLLVLLAILGTVGGSTLAVLLSGGRLREGVTIGWGLSPKGDVELVVAAFALQAGMIPQSIFTAIVLMGLVITLVSTMVFRRLIIHPALQK